MESSSKSFFFWLKAHFFGSIVMDNDGVTTRHITQKSMRANQYSKMNTSSQLHVYRGIIEILYLLIM